LKYFDWKQCAVRHLGLILNFINCRFDDVRSGVSFIKLLLSYRVTIKSCLNCFYSIQNLNQQSKSSFGFILITGCRDKKYLRDPTCDVSCISSIIQDGGQFITFKIFQESSKIWNIYNKILEMILNVLSNETIKYFVAIAL
jgi:hypothetical protein